MIQYNKGAFGLNLLLRLHGSAVYKAFVPGAFSVLVFLLIRILYREKNSHENLDHPYAVGVLVSSVSFIIVFRANYGYQRYWEACGAVHQMMSKWLDATVHMAAFHMQCDHYKDIKPPSFFDHPELLGRRLCRDRRRGSLNSIELISRTTKPPLRFSKGIFKQQQTVETSRESSKGEESTSDEVEMTAPQTPLLPEGGRLYGRQRLDGGWGLAVPHPTEWAHVDSWAYEKTPSLFLQELAHLSSLMVAVAFCTLRNDVEGGESPLDTYIPSDPWPEADPDQMKVKENTHWFWITGRNLGYWLGMDRSPAARTNYNAKRPMLVLGGVSDGEIQMLQRARGPSAKTTMAWMWFSEFITREHLAGSTGAVGPPIISRIIQFLGDGMIFYNHARKIMFIPFPFPHAQISAVYILVIMVAVPFMLEQYSDNLTIGSLLTFAVVTCLAGLHEVARELENPFRNVPNDIPLGTLLAMYNDSLIAMCSGYHPDAFWDASRTFTV